MVTVRHTARRYAIAEFIFAIFYDFVKLKNMICDFYAMRHALCRWRWIYSFEHTATLTLLQKKKKKKSFIFLWFCRNVNARQNRLNSQLNVVLFFNIFIWNFPFRCRKASSQIEWKNTTHESFDTCNNGMDHVQVHARNYYLIFSTRWLLHNDVNLIEIDFILFMPSSRCRCMVGASNIENEDNTFHFGHSTN